MPEHDDDFIEALGLSLDEWEQGDTFPLESGCALSDLASPLLVAPQSGGGLAALSVALQIGSVMIVTQTCDIVDAAPLDKPMLLVAPLCELATDRAGHASRGRMPRYLPVPWAGAALFADLSAIFPVEKTVVAIRQKQAGPRNVKEQRDVGRAIARYFERFAFPDEFNPATAALKDRFRKKAPMEDLVYEIRATPTSRDWEADTLDVHLLFLISTSNEVASRTATEWEAATAGWVRLCSPRGRIRSFSGEYISMEKLPAAEYLRSANLDIEAQS